MSHLGYLMIGLGYQGVKDFKCRMRMFFVLNKMVGKLCSVLWSVLLFQGVVVLQSCSSGQEIPEGFEVIPLSKALSEDMSTKGVYGSHSPVELERLAEVKIQYYTFDGNIEQGKLVVLDALAPHLLKIFAALYERQFYLHTVEVITAYDGNDSLSMAANNTSAHNLRPITGGSKPSLHAYGAAVDINPVQNPYVEIPCDDSVGIAVFRPAEGIKYANRRENRPGKPNRRGMAEKVVDVFAHHGFTVWGGHWNCPIDYQHFQVSRGMAELLVAMTSEESGHFFQRHVSYYRKTGSTLEDRITKKLDGQSMSQVYANDPERFWRLVDF